MKKRLADRIRQLKPGKSFTVQTESERVQALTAARTMRDCGVVNFHIYTQAAKRGGFKVIATEGTTHGNCKTTTTTKKGNK